MSIKKVLLPVLCVVLFLSGCGGNNTGERDTYSTQDTYQENTPDTTPDTKTQETSKCSSLLSEEDLMEIYGGGAEISLKPNPVTPRSIRCHYKTKMKGVFSVVADLEAGAQYGPRPISSNDHNILIDNAEGRAFIYKSEALKGRAQIELAKGGAMILVNHADTEVFSFGTGTDVEKFDAVVMKVYENTK